MTGFISEALASIQENLKQKRKSPLYGAFAFSWLAFNWKPVSIFFLSKENIYALINNVSAYASWKNQLAYPVLVAVILIIIVPALHALYAFFDAWVGSIHDSAGVMREKLNLEKITQKQQAKAESELAIEVTKSSLEADKAKKDSEAALDRLKTKEIEANIQSIEELKQSIADLKLKHQEEIEAIYRQRAIEDRRRDRPDLHDQA